MEPVLHFFVQVLQAIFIVGMVGSALVLVLTLMDQVTVIFSRDEDEEGQQRTPVADGGEQAFGPQITPKP